MTIIIFNDRRLHIFQFVNGSHEVETFRLLKRLEVPS